MNGPESLLYWISALLLATSFFLSVLSLIFKKPRAFRLAHYAITASLLTLTAFAITRWVRSGHPPFVSLFESMIAAVWFLLVFYQALRLKIAHGAVTLMPVSLIALLLMGWSASLPKDASPLSAALNNVWLFIHASFATAGAATFLMAASFSVIYLAGEERMERVRHMIPALPTGNGMPKVTFNLMLFGLILWGAMIVSGSIWAHNAWGRYWAWDPIELWSLISWLLYALLFHARLTFRLRPRIFFICNLLAAVTVVFSLWGIQYLYDTIHTYG